MERRGARPDGGMGATPERIREFTEQLQKMSPEESRQGWEFRKSIGDPETLDPALIGVYLSHQGGKL